MRVNASVYSDTGWLAGHGRSDWMDALPNQGRTLVVEPITIKECPVQLTASTRYNFGEKIVEDGGKQIWRKAPASTAPTATISDLNPFDSGKNLFDLTGLTHDEAGGHLGYSWQASDQDIPQRDTKGGNPSERPLYTYQDVIDRRDPQPAVKFARVGYSKSAPVLLYADVGGTNVKGQYFFIDPAPNGPALYVRAASLEPGSPFPLSSTESFGYFYDLQDDYAYHNSGFILGLNKTHGQIQTLRIGEVTVADSLAAMALISAGQGEREGLLKNPVAITTDLNGTVYVLQDGGGTEDSPPSILTFDVHGNYLN
ncbi:MAG: hypothetical protein O7E53_02645 [Alphaproteobacteria bacterium]|nr:hypothetical protein [Alphaproteobacteria bacterium]